MSTLVVTNECNLGGNPATFTADALAIQTRGIFRPGCSLTLDDENRGMVLQDGGQIWTDPGVTLSTRLPMTWIGTSSKIGDGVWDLGGTARAASDGPLLVVSNGTLRAGARITGGRPSPSPPMQSSRSTMSLIRKTNVRRMVSSSTSPSRLRRIAAGDGESDGVAAVCFHQPLSRCGRMRQLRSWTSSPSLKCRLIGVKSWRKGIRVRRCSDDDFREVYEARFRGLYPMTGVC